MPNKDPFQSLPIASISAIHNPLHREHLSPPTAISYTQSSVGIYWADLPEPYTNARTDAARQTIWAQVTILMQTAGFPPLVPPWQCLTYRFSNVNYGGSRTRLKFATTFEHTPVVEQLKKHGGSRQHRNLWGRLQNRSFD